MPAPQAPGTRAPSSGSGRQAPTKAGTPRWLPLAAGICGFLLLVGIIGTALALNRDGGGGQTTSGDPALATAPTFTMAADSSELVYTIDYEGYEPGDRYLVKAALSEDVIDKATAYGVSDIAEGTGTGTFVQAFGSAPRQCAKVRVQRDDKYSPWTETQCKDKAS